MNGKDGGLKEDKRDSDSEKELEKEIGLKKGKSIIFWLDTADSSMNRE